MAERVSVLIPAYNEEAHIGKVLHDVLQLKVQGIVHDVVVVDDGSKDRTREIAEKAGVKVIPLRENYGKGYGFYVGAKHLQGKTDVLLTLDADLKAVSGRQVKEMLKHLQKKEVGMVIGTVKGFVSSGLSGIRAIRMSALNPLLKAENRNWLRYVAGVDKKTGKIVERVGYGLEHALNHFIAGDAIELKSPRVAIARTSFDAGPITMEEKRKGRTQRDITFLCDETRKNASELMKRNLFAESKRKRRNRA